MCATLEGDVPCRDRGTHQRAYWASLLLHLVLQPGMHILSLWKRVASKQLPAQLMRRLKQEKRTAP